MHVDVARISQNSYKYNVDAHLKYMILYLAFVSYIGQQEKSAHSGNATAVDCGVEGHDVGLLAK